MENFPVKPKYTIGPDITKCDIPIYNKTPNSHYIEEKKKEIDELGQDLYGTVTRESHLIREASSILGLKETEDIVELALNFEEDLAIMNKGYLSSICFCFPSGFVPREKLGMSLSDIHKPVPESDRLVSMSSKITGAMSSENKFFKRYVWTLNTSGKLSQHPKKADQKVPTSLDDIYFRTETQTTLPLTGGSSSLFFVKIENSPLLDIWEDLQKRDLILQSINSMSDKIIEYKGLIHIKNFLNHLTKS